MSFFFFSFFFHELQARIIMLMTWVEGACGRNGDSADANRAEGGDKGLTSRGCIKLAGESSGGNRNSPGLRMLNISNIS